jgi:hypothetical protein
MHNKFLVQYPQLRTPEVGDLVIITNTKITGEEYFSIGDIGKIIEHDYDDNNEHVYEIDFKDQGNKKIIQHGLWWVHITEIKVVACASS